MDPCYLQESVVAKYLTTLDRKTSVIEISRLDGISGKDICLVLMTKFLGKSGNCFCIVSNLFVVLEYIPPQNNGWSLPSYRIDQDIIHLCWLIFSRSSFQCSIVTCTHSEWSFKWLTKLHNEDWPLCASNIIM